MKVLVLDEAEVHRLLPMDACIEAMAEVLAALARGEALQPLRSILKPAGAPGLMATMPAWRGGPEAAFGVKVVGVFPGNVARGLDAHQGAVVLFSGETGEPRAFLNASAITAIRTAAVSGVATRLLARAGAGDLALVGVGRPGRDPSRGDGGGAVPPPGARGQPRSRAGPGLRPPPRRPLRLRGGSGGRRGAGGAGRRPRGHGHQLGDPGPSPRLGGRRRAPQRGGREPPRPARGGRPHDGGGLAVRGPARVDA